MPRHILFFILLLVQGLLLTECHPGFLHAQTAERASTSSQLPAVLDRVKVPSEIGTFIPPAGYVPVNRAEFEALWNNARQPRQCWIKKAKFSAQLTAERKLTGTFDWDIISHASKLENLWLSPLSITIDELTWSDQKAVWGSSTEGRTGVLVQNSGLLQGIWQAKGVAERHSDEYELQFPSATATEIELSLPEGLEVFSNEGTVLHDPVSNAGNIRWNIFLGEKSRCRLTIRQSRAQLTSNILNSVQELHEYQLKQEGMSLTSRFSVQLTDSPTSEFKFEVPDSLKVLAVRHSTSAVLDWKYIPEASAQNGQNSRIIAIQFPKHIHDQVRSFQIETIGPIELNSQIPLPKLQLLNATVISSDSHLRISKPLQLQDFQPTGLKLSGISEIRQSEQELHFQQILPESELTVQLGFPACEAGFNEVCYLKRQGSDWHLQAEIVVNVHRGSLFDTTLEIPANWIVDNISLLQDDQTSPPASPQWEVIDGNESTSTIKISFPDGMHAGSRHHLQINAQSDAVLSDERMPFPVLNPLHYPLHSLLAFVPVSVHYPSDSLVDLEQEEVRELVESAVPDELADTYLVNESEVWVSENKRLYSVLPQNLRDLIISNPEQRVVVEAETRIEIREEETVESVQVSFNPQQSPISKFYIYLNSTFDTTVPILSGNKIINYRREPEPLNQTPSWNLPDQGELWVIRLDEPQSAPFKMLLERTHNTAEFLEQTLPIIYIPGTSQFLGRYQIWHDGSHSLTLDSSQSQRLPLVSQQSDLPPPAEDLDFLDGFEYRSSDERVQLITTDDSGMQQAFTGCRLELLSLISSDEGNSQQHVARYTIPGNVESKEVVNLSWLPGCDVVSIQLNGEPIAHSASARNISIPISQSPENYLEFKYRTQEKEHSWLTNNYNILYPTISINVLSFQWNVFIPASEKLVATADELFPLNESQSNELMNRLFGPLSRFETSREYSGTSLFTADDQLISTLPGVLVGFRSHSMPREISLQTRSQSKALYYSWLIFVFSLLLVAWRFNWESAQHRHYLWLWLGLALLVTLSAPATLAILTGAHFTGSLSGLVFSLLLARRKQNEQTSIIPDISLGSTKAYSASSSAGILIFLLIALNNSLSAQETPTGTLPEFSDNAVSKLRVYEIEQDADNSHPVLYVPEKYYSQLTRQEHNRQAVQQHWIQQASYDFKVNQDSGIIMTARFHVLSPENQGPSTIHIPLGGNFPLGTCSVNGKNIDDVTKGVFVPLPATVVQEKASSPEDETSTEPETPEVSETNNLAGYQLNIIELTLYPTWTESETRGTEIRVPLPVIANASVQLNFEAPPDHVEINSEPVAPVLNDAILSYQADISRREELVIRWSNSQIAKQEIVQPILAQCLAEIHPTYLELNYCLIYDWTDKLSTPPQRQQISWSVPKSLIIGGMDQNGIPYPPNEIQSVIQDNEREINFHIEPDQAGRSQVIAKFTLPRTSNIIQIPQVQLPGTEKPPELLIGLTGPKGFQISVLNSGQVSSEMQEEFSPDFLQKLKLNPQFVYQLRNSKSVLNFRYEPPIQQYQTSESHQFDLNTREIRWTYRAIVEKQAGSQPSLVHRLKVPETLQISNVSIDSGGQSILGHWSRQGENLILFLTRGWEKTHEIVLNGTFPISWEVEMSLPLVQFYSDSSLINLLYPSTFAITCEDENGKRLFQSLDNRSTNRDQQFDSFEATHGSELRLMMSKHKEQNPVQVVTRISTTDRNQYELTTEVTVPANKALDSIQLLLPPEYAASQAQLTIQSPTGYQLEETAVANQKYLTFPIDPDSTRTQRRGVEISLPLPQDTTWNLVIPTLITSDSHSSFVILESGEFQIQNMNSISNVEPELIEKVFPEVIGTDNKVHQLSRNTKEVVLSHKRQREQEKLEVLLQQVDISFQSLDRAEGATRVICHCNHDQKLSFFWNDNFTLRGGTINDSPVSGYTQNSDLLQIPVSAGENVITLHWMLPVKPNQTGLQSRLTGLPLIFEQHSGPTFLTTSSASTFFKISSESLQALSNFEFHYDTCRTLLKINEQFSKADNPLWLAPYISGSLNQIRKQKKTDSEQKKLQLLERNNQEPISAIEGFPAEGISKAHHYFRLNDMQVSAPVQLEITQVNDTVELRFVGCLLVLVLWYFTRNIPFLKSATVPGISLTLLFCLLGAIWALFFIHPQIGLIICLISTVWGTIQILMNPQISNRPEDSVIESPAPGTTL